MKLHKLLFSLTIVIQACASTVPTPTINVPILPPENPMTEAPFVLTPVELGADTARAARGSKCILPSHSVP
jgi:hypothetical protein